MRNFKIEFKWALIFIAALLVWMYIEKATGLHDTYIAQHLIYTNLFALIAISVYVLALRDKKLHFFNGKMNWKQGMISGVIISIIVALLTPLAQYIINTYISPAYFDNMIAYAVENGKMTSQNAQAFFNLKSYILQSTFFALAMGVVTSAIASFFIKSKNTTN